MLRHVCQQRRLCDYSNTSFIDSDRWLRGFAPS